MTYKLSPFLHFLKLNNYNYVVYNTLFLKKFFCKKEVVEKIKNLNLEKTPELFNHLLANHFIIEDNLKPEDEINYLIKKENINLNRPHFKVFYIIVTTGCNFKCRYCYLSSLMDYVPRVMTVDTAIKILNYFYEYIKQVKDEKPKLVLYGGEPLLNKEVVKYIIEDVQKKISDKKIPPTNIILITNGSLIDDDIAEFLKQNKVLVALSLDGKKEINDSNRIYKSGKGTYEDVVKAINLLNNHNVKPTISCTINEKNVNKLSKIIPWMKETFQVDSLSLNLFAGGDCSNKQIQQLSKDSAKKIIEVFKICRKYGIYEDTILRQMKAFVNEKPNIYYCAATGREISADPDGNLATCPAFLNTKLFNFNVNQKPQLESNIEFKKWAQRSPLLNKDCYGCLAIGLCGGGCAFNSYKNSNNIYGKDEFYCNYAKNVTAWMLKDLYTLIKNRK